MKSKHAEKVAANLVELLKQERKQKGLSHQTLADAAGIHRSTISLIESGKRIPTIVMCLKIAKAMDLQLWEELKRAEAGR